MTTEARPETQKSEFPKPENPRNTPLRKQMERLMEAVGHRELWTEQPGIEASFPIAGKDLKDCPTIAKLLPASASAPFMQLTVTVGYQLLPPDSYPMNPQVITRLGEFAIRHPNKEEPPYKTGYTGLAIEASRSVSGHSDAMIYFADIGFMRGYRVEEVSAEMKWQKLEDVDGKPEDVLEEVTRVVECLRADFWAVENQRARESLTPQEQGLVSAIVKKAKEVWSYSIHRGFHDEYVLFGHLNANGRLEKLSIGFAPGNDDNKITRWRDSNVLNGLVLEVEGDKRGKSRSSLKRTSEDVYSRYKAEGDVKIMGADANQEIPVLVLELDRDGPVQLQDVNEMVAKGFGHYLEHRAWDVEWACPEDSIILSTSIPK